MKEAIVELIGTFFLVLVVGLAVTQPGAGLLAPLAIGAILAVMIYAGGHISGAHYNPAVTVAVWLRGKTKSADTFGSAALLYIGAQLVGALLAAGAVGYLKAGSPMIPMRLVASKALVAELLFTFALAYVVLNVATVKETKGNSYFGLAIGFTVTAGAFAVGNISGAVFNPAVAVGLTLMGLSAASNLWVYLVGNLAGGVLAALTFRALSSEK